MAPRQRKPRVKREDQSLVCLIQAMVERKVVIELRNDYIVRGRLDTVDEYMNLTLSEVTTQALSGQKGQYEFIYVKGRNIRFVHLPKSLEPAKAIEAHNKAVVAAKVANFKDRVRQFSTRMVKGDGGEGASGSEAGSEPKGIGAAVLMREIMSEDFDEDLLFSGSDEND